MTVWQITFNRRLLPCSMILNQLVKITGLIQILCNISINLVYIIYMVSTEVVAKHNMPRYLPFNLLILLCILPGYISLRQINDTVLKVLLLVLNLAITTMLFIIYTNVFKTFALDA